ncbi:MAG: hypothetical protein IJS20_10475 [Bacteroidales bacterium]|nr:hypothetical protein [Bacteroidales bacterium]
MNKLLRLLATVVMLLLLHSQQAFAQIEVKVNITSGIDDPVLKSTIEENASNLLTCFNGAIMEGKKLKDKLKLHPLPKELDHLVHSMWQSSAMMCPVSEVNGKLLHLPNGGYQLRDIPISMLASEEEGDKDLVFNFDAQGNLSNIYVALELHNYRNVIIDGVVVEDFMRRQIILDFVENFRTAYNRKDLNYLKQVFSNDALIITGKVLKQKKTEGNDIMSRSLGATKVLQTVMSKEQYMKHLQKVFGRNSYIDVHFSEMSVKRHPVRDRIYGVTMKQEWNSSTYSDVGYLFLMINFEDELQPTIEVRTWQPDKYSDTGETIKRDEIYKLEDFNI